MQEEEKGKEFAAVPEGPVAVLHCIVPIHHLSFAIPVVCMLLLSYTPLRLRPVDWASIALQE